jgi:hypothetical protein
MLHRKRTLEKPTVAGKKISNQCAAMFKGEEFYFIVCVV